jgi:hypothetical protein
MTDRYKDMYKSISKKRKKRENENPFCTNYVTADIKLKIWSVPRGVLEF